MKSTIPCVADGSYTYTLPSVDDPSLNSSLKEISIYGFDYKFIMENVIWTLAGNDYKHLKEEIEAIENVFSDTIDGFNDSTLNEEEVYIYHIACNYFDDKDSIIENIYSVYEHYLDLLSNFKGDFTGDEVLEDVEVLKHRIHLKLRNIDSYGI